MAGPETSSPFRPLGEGDPREVAGYRLAARLGSGGMGTVYLSYTRGGQPVALKVVREEFAADPEFRRRFEQEVRAARRVQGAYTVPVLDSNTEGAAPWLATTYVPGLSLADAVAAYGPLPLETVLLLVGGVAEALASIHAAGVVHRDLKPGNVLLAPDGPRVIDFGIARAADATALTGTDVRVGTPSYMAPEQITGGPVGPATDVFTLGLVAYYAATGGHPFGEGAAHAVMYRAVREEPDLRAAPPQLTELIRACLAKTPEARPTPGQVIETCRALAPGQTLRREEGWLRGALAATVDRRAGAPVPAAAPRRRRRVVLLAAAAAVVGAVAGGLAVAQVLTDDTAAPPAADGGPTAPPDDARQDTGTPDTGTPDTSTPGDGGTAPSEAATGEDGNGGGAQPRSPYWEARSGEELLISAPTYRDDSDVSSLGRCFQANVTVVDLDTLTVLPDVGYRSIRHLDAESDLEYLFCDHPDARDDGISFTTGTFAGAVDDPDVSAEECYAAAYDARLPDPIPPDDVLNDHTLSAGMGICAETPEKNVVLLWIDRIVTDPSNHDLPTYFVTATQWKPEE